MTLEGRIKEQVRAFYDSVGWQQIGDGVYQNARYEDLRPVSREYIQKCHLRVGRFLHDSGRYLLDAGSGPIQYPEYLTYSKNYDYRVCLDISRIALKEARERIGEHGLFVVGDIARLPFAKNTFSGIVSLHTIHHLPGEEQERSFLELHRVLRSGGKAAVVYSWGLFSPLMRIFRAPIRWIRILRTKLRGQGREDGGRETASQQNRRSRDARLHAAGTFTFKHDYGWVRERLEALPGFEIRVWRSVSTAFLRTFIHGKALGRFWLRIVFVLEELAPRFFGRIGQYPLILFNRPEEWEAGEGRSY